MVSGESAIGAAISMPVRYWLDMLPRMRTVPPSSPFASISRGGAAVRADIGYLSADLTQRVHQVSDRALQHARARQSAC